ncbi:FAD-binding oxidoreductase [Variovorax sp. CY25R-8]|uniref:FAD-binding oxidoreductase n=1 Tax=Variovorax sp. CY25R-8 TaxID=2855501 RepID=UPI0021BBAE44|nr:FAD-binding oxidoreductase [Variovorax sp. CY25R-8]MCT8177312.1 FAD-binding oxidoreductase [Variovorax sp. CY25R-8]
MSQEAFLAALGEALGAGQVLRGEAIAERHRSDWSGVAPVLPLALVRPRDTREVSAVLRLCSEHRVPVVPQGGLTGLAGAAVPRADAIALSLERMNAIESLDAAAGTLTVQAGATLQSVQEAAAARGLLFGVDFGARGSCQIGGALSTNAGGNGVLQFGMMREQALGLEVALADGRVLPMLRPMLKNNTGYDLKQFFIGAEGTLGVITRALLRLHPAPRAKATALVALPDFEAALVLLRRLGARFPGALAAFELMWRDFVQTSLRWQQLREPFDAAHPLVALVDVAGEDEAALREALEAALAGAMEEGAAVDAVIAQSQSQARAFWKIREATAELPVHMHPPINLDVSLPMASIGRFADDCRAALDARWPGHHSLFFGHVGDSNLQVTTDGRAIGGEAEAFERMVYAQVEARGGSISAEHGIGLHKKPYLGASRTPDELAAMRAIKQALDPLHLLNPGKVFDL